MTGVDVPGVYVADARPRDRRDLATGVPVFIGVAATGPVAGAGGSASATRLTSWADFVARCGPPRADGFLGDAVRGFFENGGGACYALRMAEGQPMGASLDAALDALETLDSADLVCAPDLARAPAEAVALQRRVLERLATGHRMALLDALPGAPLDAAVRQWQQLRGTSPGARNGALYFPWLRVPGDGGLRSVPPCGHVAGLVARTDRRAGFFAPPANDVVDGVVDLDADLGAADQRRLDPDAVVNCLRAFPGRGIRVWGARTTSGEPDWRYVNVRRLVLTLARWFEAQMADVVMEPNGPALWTRIRREVNDYLYKLFRAGALRGTAPQEAYFLKCDQETTPADARERGEVRVLVGVAPVVPAEFIVVQLLAGAAGVQVGSPSA